MTASQACLPRPGLRRTLALLACLGLALAVPALRAVAAPRPGDPAAGVASISKKTIEEHVLTLADGGMEGRDSPSEGLRRAAEYISQRFAESGLVPASDAAEVLRELGAQEPMVDAGGGEGEAEGDEEAGRTRAEAHNLYLRPYRLRMDTPDPEACGLVLEVGDERTEFQLGRDFVPALLCDGSAEGQLEFGGFGISSKKQQYSDFKSLRLEDKIVLMFEGEPRNRRKFEGEEVTLEASLWTKLESLQDEDVAGVLLVRRAPEGAEDDTENRLDFRHTYARWQGYREPAPPRQRPPVLVVSMECASTILGTDAGKLAVRMDKSGRPAKVRTKGRTVRMVSGTRQRDIRLDNVVGILPGSDPELAEEYVVLGAHYDHIGVDPRGRVGAGADDNASGTSALLSITAALAEAEPRRSILVCCFSAEEDGLVGSKEICKRLPVPKEKVVAMINLDMVGFGDEDEVVVLGVKRNPKLDKVLDRAKRLSRTGVKKIVTGKGEELWKRSDHISFHEIGIPVLFFFEGLPLSRNADYHTWRDTPDGVDCEKITRTARLVFNTVWILANDDERPPAPSG